MNLNNTLKKKLLAVVVILIVMAIFVILLNDSYGYMEKSVEGSCVSLEVGSLQQVLTGKLKLSKGEREKIEFIIKNDNNITSKYQMIYTSSDDLTNISIGYSNRTNDLPSGDINPYEEKSITIILENTGTTDVTVKIGIKSGLSTNTIDDIILNDNEYRINNQIQETLIEQLELEDKVDKNTKINFNNISSSTNGNGIYTYVEAGKAIYYYRGATTDNNVIFNNMCWKIIRTTKNNGVKIIYNGLPVDGNCENTGENTQIGSSYFNLKRDDNAYVGYMYGLTSVTTDTSRCLMYDSTNDKTIDKTSTYTTETDCNNAGGKWTTTAYEATHANVTNSIVKKEIDEWYKTNMINVTEKLEDEVYCNDRTTDMTGGKANEYDGYTTLGYGNNATLYAATLRVGYNLRNIIPNLNCLQENDSFTVSEENGNGELTYPVGLITADEITLAGGKAATINDELYLNTGVTYHTMSVYAFYVYGATNFCYGDFNALANIQKDNVELGIRPVITMKSNLNVIKGNGNSNNPYIIN